MSKKKKKHSGANRSVLDEPILKAKEPAAEETSDAAASDESPASPSAADRPEVTLFDGGSASGLPREAEDRYDDAAGGTPGSGTEPDELEDDFPDDIPVCEKPPLLERIIEYTSAALSVFMLGASLVFWYVILRFLLRSPYALADPTQMMILLAGCALFPAAVALIQHRLRRPVTAERWLICLCLSGALTTLLTVISQTLIRHAGYSLSDLPLTLCCAVSGCALPAALFLGLRLLVIRFSSYLRFENAKRWEVVRRDVLSLTDFDRS